MTYKISVISINNNITDFYMSTYDEVMEFIEKVSKDKNKYTLFPKFNTNGTIVALNQEHIIKIIAHEVKE